MENQGIAKKKIVILLSVVGVLIIAYFLYYDFYGNHHIKTDNAYTTGDQRVVTAQISGSVVDLKLKNTDEVEKGQLIARVEDTDYKLALEEAKVNLGKAVRDYYSINIQTIKDKESLNSAQSNYDTVSKDYKRSKELFDAGIISNQKMERVENDYINAKNTLDKAEKQYEDSRLQAKSDDVESHPAVAAAIVNLKKAHLDLSRTNIYSPSNGKTAKKSMYLGEKVREGQELFTVVDLSKAWVEANFKETQLRNIKIGNPVKVKSDLNHKVYEGIVVGISGGSGNAFSLLPPQNATGNWIKITQRVPVRIALTEESLNENGMLPLGTTMTVNVDTSIVEKDPDIESQRENYNPYALEDQKIDEIVEEIIENNSIL